LPLAVLSVTMRYVESIETITADAVVVLVATALPGATATLELVVGACWALAATTTPAASIATVMGANFMGKSPRWRERPAAALRAAGARVRTYR
jgi:hypothetical protein